MPKVMVTDGVKYLRQNQRGDYYFSNKKDATVWNTQKQALNALNNGICKSTRKRFFVEKANKTSDPCDVLNDLLEADTSDFNLWLTSISNFDRIVKTLAALKKELCKELSDINNELCDIQHYIEFGKLNACQGWAAAEMMKNTRQQRRKVKDAMYIIDEIIKGKSRDVSEYESAQTAIFYLNNRKYTPRKLNFLFEGALSVQC